MIKSICLKQNRDRSFLLFSITFPLLLFVLLKNKELTLSFDSYVYLALADSMVKGNGFTLCGHPHIFHSPGFPWLISCIQRCTGINAITAGHLLCAFSLFATVYGMYWISKKVFLSQKVGILAAMLFLFSGRVQEYSLAIMAENMLAPLYIWIIYLCCQLIRSGVSWIRILSMTGLLIAAYYCKPEGILMFPACFLILFAGRWMLGRNCKELFPHVAVSILLFLLALSPAILRIKQETGYWSISGKTNPILLWSHLKQQGLNPGKEIRGQFFSRGENVEGFFDNLTNIQRPEYHFNISFFLKNLAVIPIEYVYKYCGIPLFILFLFTVFRSPLKQFFYFQILCIILLIFCISIANLYTAPRFIYPILPIIYFLSSYSLFWIKKFLPNPTHWKWLIILCIAGQYPFLWLFDVEYTVPVAETAIKEIQKIDSNSFSISGLDMAYCYYNGMCKSAILPTTLTNEVELLDYCHRYNFDYILVNNTPIPSYNAGIMKNDYQLFEKLIEIPIHNKETNLLILKPK